MTRPVELTPPSIARLGGRLRALAGRDFSPAFSAKVRRVAYHPLGVLVLAAGAALLCGFFLHAQGFVLAGGVAAVIALGVAWPLVSLRGVGGTLAFDRARAVEGEAVTASVTLRNRLPWAAWGLAVRDGFGGDPTRPAVGVSAAPGRRVAVCRWAFTPARRGAYPLAPPRLTTGFPFGVWETSRRLAVEAPLVVWPKTFPVGPVPPSGGDRQVEGAVSRSRVGSTGDVVGVRPYRRGDSPRRIHWGQSAKHDRLIVCELQSNSRPLIQVVLDADPRVHTGGAGGSREWAVRVAASLAKGWLGDGARVGLTWAGFDLPAASGAAQIHKILDALAALPDAPAAPVGEVLACPVCRGFRDGLQVIVTTDRAAAHAACGACAAADQRWVVLTAAGFAAGGEAAAHHCEDGRHVEPWLRIDSAADVPALLRGGWREARHGS